MYVRGRPLTGRAGSPVAAVLAGDPLQRAQVLGEAGGTDPPCDAAQRSLLRGGPARLRLLVAARDHEHDERREDQAEQRGFPEKRWWHLDQAGEAASAADKAPVGRHRR